MIQKKICMVGFHATGKTSLVRQFVDSIFSERYLSTVGVKIDRKPVDLGGTDVNLLLWDLEGRGNGGDLRVSYLRGAAAILYVVDGTRPDTLDGAFELRDRVVEAVGDVPSIVALNKSDLESDWQLGSDAYSRLESARLPFFLTSAKTGGHVEEAFHRLATATLSQSDD